MRLVPSSISSLKSFKTQYFLIGLDLVGAKYKILLVNLKPGWDHLREEKTPTSHHLPLYFKTFYSSELRGKLKIVVATLSLGTLQISSIPVPICGWAGSVFREILIQRASPGRSEEDNEC